MMSLKLIRIPEEMRERIQRYQSDEKLASEGEAIRCLLEIGLEAASQARADEAGDTPGEQS
jgi:hypothetical protein